MIPCTPGSHSAHFRDAERKAHRSMVYTFIINPVPAFFTLLYCRFFRKNFVTFEHVHGTKLASFYIFSVLFAKIGQSAPRLCPSAGDASPAGTAFSGISGFTPPDSPLHPEAGTCSPGRAERCPPPRKFPSSVPVPR